ncbi:alkaline phosphatase family protein [Verrucomicrobium spinosum]|uniref:alkaline phosphatase family protein n=1 Tax=Verrucomicrobium spinosum TaxID=2736 RepID=UPI000A6C17F4|nr:alkaline phosphatase family protein [Verrucomicrobium spinosum]
MTRAPTITWSFPELPNAEGPIEKEMIAKGLLTPEQVTWFHKGPQGKNIAWRDSTWTQAAIHMLTEHKPNFLMYHTLNTDANHHRYGPQSWPSYTALAYADRLIGDVVAAVEKAGMKDRTTFFIATDHGFKKVQKYVYPNVILKQAGLVRALGPNIRQCEAAAVPQGGMAFVYVTDPARRAEFLPKLKELFSQAEGIDKVIEGTDGPTLACPLPRRTRRRRPHPLSQSGLCLQQQRRRGCDHRSHRELRRHPRLPRQRSRARRHLHRLRPRHQTRRRPPPHGQPRRRPHHRQAAEASDPQCGRARAGGDFGEREVEPTTRRAQVDLSSRTGG